MDPLAEIAQFERSEIAPWNRKSCASSCTQSIAKRSGTRTVPSIDRVAPRCALIGAQQPLAAIQFEPRSGGWTTSGRERETPVGTPVKLICWTACGGLSNDIEKECSRRVGRRAGTSRP